MTAPAPAPEPEERKEENMTHDLIVVNKDTNLRRKLWSAVEQRLAALSASVALYLAYWRLYGGGHIDMVDIIPIADMLARDLDAITVLASDLPDFPAEQEEKED